MDVQFTYLGELFAWDLDRAAHNYAKHGINFEEACQVFFDPFYRMLDASREGEQRWAMVGYSEVGNLLYVVTAERQGDYWRIISARKATKAERRKYEKNDPY